MRAEGNSLDCATSQTTTVYGGHGNLCPLSLDDMLTSSFRLFRYKYR